MGWREVALGGARGAPKRTCGYARGARGAAGLAEETPGAGRGQRSGARGVAEMMRAGAFKGLRGGLRGGAKASGGALGERKEGVGDGSGAGRDGRAEALRCAGRVEETLGNPEKAELGGARGLSGG